MALMSTNAESPRRNYGDILQLTNYILDSGATCQMTPEILGFILGLLVETYKYVQVADGNLVTVKKTGELQIKIRYDYGKPFVATLYNLLLTPYLCDQMCSVITPINMVHTYLFHKGLCKVLLVVKKQNTVTLLHSAQRKHSFMVKTK